MTNSEGTGRRSAAAIVRSTHATALAYGRIIAGVATLGALPGMHDVALAGISAVATLGAAAVAVSRAAFKRRK